ncbi:MAG: hypothetical protein EYC67_08820 [Betaproteobacteria bacterium]|nr:MAG: hypothetical protein EYC67_08820 [Betaproteobacteria bacterium]
MMSLLIPVEREPSGRPVRAHLRRLAMARGSAESGFEHREKEECAVAKNMILARAIAALDTGQHGAQALLAGAASPRAGSLKNVAGTYPR